MPSQLEEELIDKIIQEIRKYNRVTVGKDDPLFSIVTANSLVLEKYIEIFERMLTKHHTDLESMTVNHLSHFRKKTEDEFNQAITQSKTIIAKEASKGIDAFNEKILEMKNLIDKDSPHASTPPNKITLFIIGSVLFAAGYMLALFMIR